MKKGSQLTMYEGFFYKDFPHEIAAKLIHIWTFSLIQGDRAETILSDNI